MALALSNEAMVAAMIDGATIDDTVTPANPTPPTNISCVGETPPTTAGLTPVDSGTAEDWEDPLLFAAALSGVEPEGAGHEGYDSLIDATFNDLFPPTSVDVPPNLNHPSHPDYEPPATTMGASHDAPEEEQPGDDDLGDGPPSKPKKKGKPKGKKKR